MTKYQHTFEVVGEGDFPVEMLRLDNCCPEDPMDARMMRTSGRRRATRHRTIRLVTLTSDRRWRPSLDGWESRGWHVRNHSTVEVPAFREMMGP